MDVSQIMNAEMERLNQDIQKALDDFKGRVLESLMKEIKKSSPKKAVESPKKVAGSPKKAVEPPKKVADSPKKTVEKPKKKGKKNSTTKEEDLPKKSSPKSKVSPPSPKKQELDVKSMTVVEIKDELKKRNVPFATKATKAVLVKLLNESLKNQPTKKVPTPKKEELAPPPKKNSAKKEETQPIKKNIPKKGKKSPEKCDSDSQQVDNNDVSSAGSNIDGERRNIVHDYLKKNKNSATDAGSHSETEGSSSSGTDEVF